MLGVSVYWSGDTIKFSFTIFFLDIPKQPNVPPKDKDGDCKSTLI